MRGNQITNVQDLVFVRKFYMINRTANFAPLFQNPFGHLSETSRDDELVIYIQANAYLRYRVRLFMLRCRNLRERPSMHCLYKPHVPARRQAHHTTHGTKRQAFSELLKEFVPK